MGLDAIVIVVGLVSGVLGIIGYLLPIATTKARYINAAYVIAITLAVAFGTYQATRYARLNSIARMADRLNSNVDFDYTTEGYVEAAMTFLEKSKDIYPDAYKRASDDYNSVMKSTHRSQDVVDLKYRLKAIVKAEGDMASQ